MIRRIVQFVGHLTLGCVCGATVGVVYWVVVMALDGHSLVAAIHGEVEDALGTLQGLTFLGAACGLGVGLCWAWWSENKPPGEKATRAPAKVNPEDKPSTPMARE